MYQRISTSPSSHAFRSPGLLLFRSVTSGYTGNAGKHKACFLSMTVLLSKFALGQTSHPVTSSPSYGLLMVTQRIVHESFGGAVA